MLIDKMFEREEVFNDIVWVRRMRLKKQRKLKGVTFYKARDIEEREKERNVRRYCGDT